MLRTEVQMACNRCNFQGKTYVFDRIFREQATQEDVYTYSAKPIVAGQYYALNKETSRRGICAHNLQTRRFKNIN